LLPAQPKLRPHRPGVGPAAGAPPGPAGGGADARPAGREVVRHPLTYRVNRVNRVPGATAMNYLDLAKRALAKLKEGTASAAPSTCQGYAVNAESLQATSSPQCQGHAVNAINAESPRALDREELRPRRFPIDWREEHRLEMALLRHRVAACADRPV